MKQFIAKIRERRTIKYNSLVRKIVMFLCTAVIRRRRKKKRFLASKAVIIQRFVRGFVTRKVIFRVVKAGVKLNEMWRRHMAYKNLKSRLRRVDRPYSIVLNGVRNIPKRSMISDSIKIKISVWWHPLVCKMHES